MSREIYGKDVYSYITQVVLEVTKTDSNYSIGGYTNHDNVNSFHVQKRKIPHLSVHSMPVFLNQWTIVQFSSKPCRNKSLH